MTTIVLIITIILSSQVTGEVIAPFAIYPRQRISWMLGKLLGVRMKTADKLIAIGLFPFGIFALMFVSALIGDIHGTMSAEQVQAIAQWSMLPLILAAILIVPACFMPIHVRARSN